MPRGWCDHQALQSRDWPVLFSWCGIAMHYISEGEGMRKRSRCSYNITFLRWSFVNGMDSSLGIDFSLWCEFLAATWHCYRQGPVLLVRQPGRYLVDKETPTGTCAVAIVNKERSLTTRLGAANKQFGWNWRRWISSFAATGWSLQML